MAATSGVVIFLGDYVFNARTTTFKLDCAPLTVVCEVAASPNTKLQSVYYTHLDVYKRQVMDNAPYHSRKKGNNPKH